MIQLGARALGEYRGGVVGIRVSAPAKQRRWDTVKGKGLYAGGIWTWGGVAVNRRNGDVYVATGNSLGSAREDEGYAERVVSLSSELRVKQRDAPLRGPFVAGDRDFGSSPVLFRAAGCTAQLVALNKNGQLFLYDSASLSSGPRQSLAVASPQGGGRVPLIGMPAWDPASRTLLLVSPSNSPDGSRPLT